MKQLCRVLGPAVAALTLYASTAHAHSERRFGFVIGYPAQVGVQWQGADSQLDDHERCGAAAHDLSARFRIFGEAGVDDSRGTVDRPFADLEQRRFGLRSGVGAVVPF